MGDFILLQKKIEKELKGVPLLGLSQINRVQKNSELISVNEKFEKEILNASILLHNIGAKHAVEFHQDLNQVSLNLAKKFLSSCDFSPKEIQKILHCIQESSFRGNPKTIEAKILHDSVLLDEIGVIGIVKDSFIFLKQKNPAHKLTDSLKSKVSLIKSSFTTVKGKELALKRVKEFEENVQKLEEELQ
jgi:HD superfamily phosphodiesterase